MSGLDTAAAVYGLIGGTIAIIETSVEIYDAVKDKSGIPLKLRKVSDKLPSLLEILRGAESQYKAGQPDGSTWISAAADVKRCDEACQELQDLLGSAFPKIGVGRVGRFFKGTGTVLSRKHRTAEQLLAEIYECLEMLVDRSILTNTGLLEDIKKTVDELLEASGLTQHNVHGTNIGRDQVYHNTQSGTGQMFTGPGGTFNFHQGSLRNLIGGNEFEKQLREEKRLGTLQEWLRFAAIDYRKADIAEHHEKTFQWVFQSTSTPVEENVAGSYFVEWLQHGKGLYWIQGTLGSGKSTLMRYIVEHSSLQSHLRTWACGSTLHVASFFFTKTGPEVLQRSLQGLYRTLLESLIRGNEELAWVAFPGWRASDRHAPDPPVGLLRDALQRILRSHTGSQKFCFLIDGLDEYEEDDSVLRTKLAKDVLKLAKLPGMKILVASRPEASFVDCFSDCPTMELHRLTKRDITRYVKAELDHDDRTKSLTRLDAAKLAAEIVRKARGVFLWVILAVANILDGVMFGETYLDIQAQISTLHNDLYQAFKQVLSVRIQFQYRQEVARCLKMASHHRKYVYWTTSYHRYGLGSRHGPTDPKLCSLAAYTIGRRIDRSDTYNHLLLAIEDPNELDRQINTLRKNLPRRSCGLFTWTSSGMSLLHSSMDEFLDRPEVAEFLQNQAGEDFDVALALVAGRVADLVATLHGMSEAEAAASNRGLSDPQQMKHLIMKHLLEILQCIELAYNPEKTALEELLLCLDRVLHKNWCVANLPRLVELTVGVDFMIELESTAGSFLLKGNLITLAVYHGCVRYIRHISQADRGLSSDGMLLFDMVNFGFLCATSFQSSASDELQGPDVHEQVKRSAHWSAPEQHNQSWDGSSHFSIAELLLEEGADPNRPASYIPSWAAKSKSQSPWQRALDGIHECTLAPLSQREPILQRAFSLARCMLEHGADPVYITGQWSGGRMIYTNLFEELLERTCCGHNKLQSCSCSSAARLQSQVLSLIDLAQAKRDEK